MATKSKRTIKKKEKIVEPVVENIEIVERTPVVKRNIKKPTLSVKTINKDENVENVVSTVETNSSTTSEPSKRKRTLKLGLETSKPQIKENIIEEPLIESIIEEKPIEVEVKNFEEPKQIVTINQNSAFFNEPSIFAKFNIDITETEKPYDIISGEINTSFEATISKNKNIVEDEDADFNTIVISEELPALEESNSEEILEQIEEIEEIEEVSDEATEIIDTDEEIIEENIEQINIEEEITNQELSESLDFEDLIDSIDLADIETEDLNLENINLDELSLDDISLDDIDFNENQDDDVSIDFEDLLDSDLVGEATNDIVAEDNDEVHQNNIINISDFFELNLDEETDNSEGFEEQAVEEKVAADSIVGKFFDSSVPHLDTDKIEFSAIKNSNESPIFKNFSFEDVGSNVEEIIEFDGIKLVKTEENNINNIQKTLENFTPNAQLDNNLENSAAPSTLTIPVINTDTVYPSEATDLLDSNITDYSNIITPLSDSSYVDDDFSVEDYFGVSENDEDTTKTVNDEILENKNEEISNLTKLLEKYSETISDLSERISTLENNSNEEVNSSEKDLNVESEVEQELEINVEDLGIEDLSLISDDLNIEDLDVEDLGIKPEDLTIDDLDIENLDINPEDLNIDDLELTPEDLGIDNLEAETTENDQIELSSEDINIEDLDLSDIDLDYIDDLEIDANKELEDVGNILSEALSSKDASLKDELLSEVLSFEEDAGDLEESLLEEVINDKLSKKEISSSDSISDFSKIIESLSKAITELEQAPDIKHVEEVSEENIEATTQETEAPKLVEAPVTNDKAINILINKNDVFSISIQNETYEIVADFDGISVLSENIRLSTPKNNFFVTVGNKYIEIFNKKNHFVVNTNFEDIEFTNAINNITFAKKNNKIELIIKEAFKLNSVNNKIELSMLNKAIANLANNQPVQNTEIDESSVCDNKTLLISEETQKVYLPYTIEEVMKKLKTSSEYQTVKEVIENEYTVPLSTFKMPIISRFKEAYRFMRVKEKSSVYAAMDLALELMFNSNLNPAVIRAAKDLKELNIYLDCLYENEIEKFDCFKIVYKVLPKIK